jgi:hypothetical protein
MTTTSKQKSPQQSPRREKTRKQPPPSSSSPSVKLTEQLDQATQRLMHHEATMNELHQNWKQYLAFLSYFVILLTLHQMTIKSGTCVREIRKSEITPWSFTVGISILMRHSAAFVLASVMAVAWSVLLRKYNHHHHQQQQQQQNPNNDDDNNKSIFSHPAFLLAQSCILPIFSILWYQRNSESCLEFFPNYHPQQEQVDDTGNNIAAKASTGFPVVLVFHCIASLSIWFMQKQTRQLQINIQAVQQLRQEIGQAPSSTTTTRPSDDTARDGKTTKSQTDPNQSKKKR